MLRVQRLAEKIFVVFSLLLFSGAITSFLAFPNPLSRILQLTFCAILVVNILLIMARWKKVVSVVFKEKILWILIAIAVLSILWSGLPVKLTLFRSHYSGLDIGILPLVRATLFGVYFATCYSLKEQMRLLLWTLGIAALLSLVVGLAVPSYGVMGNSISMQNSISVEGKVHIGAWQGIYGHKNFLGRTMALSAIAFLLFSESSHKYKWVGWVCFSLSVGLIVLSTSKTALVIFLTILILLPLYKSLRWNYTLTVLFFITITLLVGCTATLFLDNSEAILGTLGRDLTLTGRTDLWAAVLEKIWEQPWLGHGYNAFWLGLDDYVSEADDLSYAVGWPVPHAHNGFLDLWLDLGLLGLSMFTISFVTVTLRAIKWVRLTDTPEGLYPLVYLTFAILSNLTESSLLREDIYLILYISVVLSMHRMRENWVECDGRNDDNNERYFDEGKRMKKSALTSF